MVDYYRPTGGYPGSTAGFVLGSRLAGSKSTDLLRQVTKSGISDGMSSANLRINRSVGFLPYFFKPAFQSSPPSAAATPRPIRSDGAVSAVLMNL
jgi:hypothetical protein